MDPLTQGLLGATTAHLGFRRRLGGGAGWAAALAAMLADLDIALIPLLRRFDVGLDEFAMLRHHRGLSHSLVMIPVFALIVAYPWWRRRKRLAAAQYKPPVVDKTTHPEIVAQPAAPPPRAPSFWCFFGCTFVAAASHPLLDVCTTYGTQLLAPFSSMRLALHAVPIIDLFYTSILILTLLLCLAAGKLSRRRKPRGPLVVAWLGFLLSLSYLGGGYALRYLAARQARELAEAKISPGTEKILRADAYPYLGTIFLWRTTVETDRRWFAARLRPLGSRDPAAIRQESVRKSGHVLIRRARKLPRVQTYEWFAMGRLRGQVRREKGEQIVEFHDMRYGRKPESVESMWPLRVTYGRAGEPPKARRAKHLRKRPRGEMLKEVWKEIITP